MNDVSPELKNLLMEYKGNTYEVLKDHPQLEYLYALSDMRENLLEWFEFDKEASLLQIGSDSGALTGLYSRRVREVTVLGAEDADLELNRARHEEKGNIRYAAGDLMTYSGGTFDYVVLVGSLRTPVKEQIEKAKTLLNPGGKLILAVCNRLGLKYLAGAKPDDVRLSRAEVEELFEDGAFLGGHLEFYYPMPDYRLPVTIYSDRCLPAKGDLTHAVLAYDYPKYLRFDVGRMYDEVCQGKQFETFANSFLTIWSSYEEN